MAGNKILVVDDDPSLLRLIAVILRKAGYEVSLASNAEQALTALQTLQPDVILVDLRLPGIGGLAFTRRIRESAPRRPVVILAMTAFSEGEIEQAAREAGCDGFLRKPLDAASLTAFVAHQLRNEIPAAPAVVTQTASTGVDSSFSFLEYASERCRTLVRDLKFGFPDSTVSRLLRQMAAEAKGQGFEEVPPLAEQAADVVDALWRDPEVLAETLCRLSRVLENLKEEGARRNLPALDREVNSRQILVAGFQPIDAMRIAGIVEKSGAAVQLIPVGSSLAPDVAQACDLAIIRVGGVVPEPFWYAPELSNIPLILAGEYQLLRNLDSKVLTMARELLLDNWSSEEALLRITLALSREVGPATVAAAPAVPSVLVVDDDPGVGRLIEALLGRSGIQCSVAGNGELALQMIARNRPHAAIIDLNLPGMDGFEVIKMLQAQAPEIRMMLLTGRNNDRDIAQGFELGADDYIAKPFKSLELLTRLRRLLPKTAGAARPLATRPAKETFLAPSLPSKEHWDFAS